VVLRIGTNLGDVMVEGGDPYGDGMTLPDPPSPIGLIW
jgi:hypothetical protein